MKIIISASVIALLGATAATAQEISYQLNGGVGQWSNNLDAHGIEDNDGIAGEDNRTVFDFGGSVAYEFQPGWIGEAALGFHSLDDADSSLDTDDATSYTRDLTLRLHHNQGMMNFGAFVGVGRHNDYGDSDEKMKYSFYGLEAGRDFSGFSLFGQIGAFDSEDEFDEGIQDGSFIRVGGDYEIRSGLRIVSAIAYAEGDKKGSDPAKVIDFEIGVERDIDNSPFTIYGKVQHQRNSYKDSSGDTYGDTFNIITAGFKATFGKKAMHGRSLPSFGKWVAYQANEIE